jgi:hypothetical protein
MKNRTLKNWRSILLLLAMVVPLVILKPNRADARSTQQVITLLYFNGTALEEGVLLKWATISEFNTSGFILQRSDTESGPYEDISEIIPAVGSPTGAEYEHLDENVVFGQTYWYILVVIKIDGDPGQTPPLMVMFGELISNYIPIIRST